MWPAEGQKISIVMWPAKLRSAVRATRGPHLCCGPRAGCCGPRAALTEKCRYAPPLPPGEMTGNPQPASHPRHRSARWQAFFPFHAELTTGGGGDANKKNFPLEVDPPPRLNPCSPPPEGWGRVLRNISDIFQCGPRATTCGPRAATQVRPASRAGRTSQFRGPHYNAHFWTLGGPHFMASRATFGPRAALFTSLFYINS